MSDEGATGGDIYVQEYLFDSLREMSSLTRGTDATPFSISWADCGEVFRLGLEIELSWLPSRCEIFFFLADMPQQFDAVFHFDETRAVEPLEKPERWHDVEPPETYPSGI